MLDSFACSESQCVFVRLIVTDDLSVTIEATGGYKIESCEGGGWLLLPSVTEEATYWLPQPPMLRSVDNDGHIVSECIAEIAGVEASSSRLAVRIARASNSCLDLVAWKLTPNEAAIAAGLKSLTTCEKERMFLWGSHTTYRRPADVYVHLIQGHIYENRYAWPFKRKICSEDDARALFLVLSSRERIIGNRIYSLLKQQVLMSVIARQSANGSWRHGEWTNAMESHNRLNGSALQLLMDALSEKDDQVVRSALERGAEFLSKQRDQTRIGVWFLHDELELDEVRMRQAPFQWSKCDALGKSRSNMLVLNTHLDAQIILDRYREISQDEKYGPLVMSARDTTRAVLSLRPAEWLYRVLLYAINLTALPTAVARTLPLPVRALKRIAWKYLIPNLHRIKAKLPRLVMPGGYIDRAVPLRSWADNYLPINIMDLLRYRRRFPDAQIETVAREAIAYTFRSQLLDRWQELDDGKYALGFWAEALYHLCTLEEDVQYRQWLAEAVIRLENLAMGLPPSLLGCNAEVVPSKEQFHIRLPIAPGLRVVNLSRTALAEFLLVNVTDKCIPFDFSSNDLMGFKWSGSDAAQNITANAIPGRGWFRGVKPGSALVREQALSAVA